MAGPRKKRTVRNPGAKVTRRTANRHFKKVRARRRPTGLVRGRAC